MIIKRKLFSKDFLDKTNELGDKLYEVTPEFFRRDNTLMQGQKASQRAIKDYIKGKFKKKKQKEFGLVDWWKETNRKAAIQQAKRGARFQPGWKAFISEEEYNSYKYPHSSTNKITTTKPPTEVNYIESIASRNPKFKKELYGILKLSEDKSIMGLEPEWGDGDEYPTFNITNLAGNKFDSFTSVLKYHRQYSPIGINVYKNQNWGLEDNPTKAINLKQFLLQTYQKELKNYEDAKKRDGYGWDDDQYDDVISWIKALIGGVKKYL